MTSLFTTPHWTDPHWVDPGPRRVPDPPQLIADWPPHVQIKKLAEVSNLLQKVDSPLSAGYVLGMVRGRLNVLRELGLVSHREAGEIGAAIKGQFDERWPGLFNEMMGRG